MTTETPAARLLRLHQCAVLRYRSWLRAPEKTEKCRNTFGAYQQAEREFNAAIEEISDADRTMTAPSETRNTNLS